MASDLEKTMDEYESALVDALQSSTNPSGSSYVIRERLVRARIAVDKTLNASAAKNEFRAAVDRAFGTARQNFR
jgi:hypothetical protein